MNRSTHCISLITACLFAAPVASAQRTTGRDEVSPSRRIERREASNHVLWLVWHLPALVLLPENRGPGFGIFQVWYFAGAAFMPMLAGYLHDLTGGATVSLLGAAGMMFAVLCLHGLFRFEQRRLAAG